MKWNRISTKEPGFVRRQKTRTPLVTDYPYLFCDWSIHNWPDSIKSKCSRFSEFHNVNFLCTAEVMTIIIMMMTIVRITLTITMRMTTIIIKTYEK